MCTPEPKFLTPFFPTDAGIRVCTPEPEFLTDLDAEHQHDQTVSSVSVKFEGELLVTGMEIWIDDLLRNKGADLFRYKGIMAVKTSDTKYLFQGLNVCVCVCVCVCARAHTHTHAPGVGMLFNGDYSDFKWGADETRECRFVFIGRNLNKQVPTIAMTTPQKGAPTR